MHQFLFTPKITHSVNRWPTDTKLKSSDRGSGAALEMLTGRPRRTELPIMRRTASLDGPPCGPHPPTPQPPTTPTRFARAAPWRWPDPTPRIFLIHDQLKF